MELGQGLESSQAQAQREQEQEAETKKQKSNKLIIVEQIEEDCSFPQAQ